MTQAHDAADVIRRLANQYEGMKYAADVLEKVGSLENATNEAIAAKNKAEAERDVLLNEAKAATDAAAQSIADAAQTVEGLLKAANQQAAEVVAAATAKGQDAFERAIESANREAQAITAKARADAEEAVGKTVLAQTTLFRLNDEIQANESKLGELTAQAADAEDRLAKARAAASKMLGA